MHGYPDEDVVWTLDAGQRLRRKDKEDEDKKAPKEPEPMRCEKCFAMFLAHAGNASCPKCGYRKLKKGEELAFERGLLKRVSRRAKPRLGDTEAVRRAWQRALAISAAKNGTFGRAAAIFKSTCGVLPWEVGRDLPRCPSYTTTFKWRDKIVDFYPGYRRNGS